MHKKIDDATYGLNYIPFLIFLFYVMEVLISEIFMLYDANKFHMKLIYHIE